MSVELTVYMARSAMPSPRDWAQAIVDAGFPAELDAEFDVDSFSGFLPCRYCDANAGFEYCSGPIEFVDELELPSDFDFSVTSTSRINTDGWRCTAPLRTTETLSFRVSWRQARRLRSEAPIIGRESSLGHASSEY